MAQSTERETESTGASGGLMRENSKFWEAERLKFARQNIKEDKIVENEFQKCAQRPEDDGTVRLAG